MNLFNKRIIMLCIIMFGFMFSGIPIFIPDRTDILVHKFAIFGGIIAFSGLLWGIFTIKCPHCRHSLPLRSWNIQFCPSCGEKIE